MTRRYATYRVLVNGRQMAVFVAARRAESRAASGGILGLGARTSGEERAVIKRVATEIQKTHEAVARRLAGSL